MSTYSVERVLEQRSVSSPSLVSDLEPVHSSLEGGHQCPGEEPPENFLDLSSDDLEAEFELDLVSDPLAPLQLSSETGAWEAGLASIVPRSHEGVSEEAQREQMQNLLTFMRGLAPSGAEQELAGAASLLQNLPSILRNLDLFTSGSFSRFFPAWEQLIGGSGRKSSRQVLEWLKAGVNRPLSERRRPKVVSGTWWSGC